MFLLDNLWIVLLIGMLFFIAFTYINIYVEVNEAWPSLIYTIIFFNHFLRTPLQSVNTLYKIEEELWDQVFDERKISLEKQMRLKKVLRSRLSIFLVLSRAGMFSYRDTMSALINSIKEERIIISSFKERIIESNADKLKDNIDYSDFINKFV